MGVLGGAENTLAKVGGLKLRDIIDDHEARVEVDDVADKAREEVDEIGADVVEWLVKGAVNGGGDLPPHQARVETVYGKWERREGGEHGGAEEARDERRAFYVI
ncbi:hypothetical protein J5N97_028552 [Dioscorea zingiberensis]|uniref:Uncharacterized protein n=1 Tax=Dioscorea zingiberensis TaxID=325984 RepID=A0A9D5BZE7_9LILI|nr:hypothetical protein J5N97_028552 [Dioscorea zingiberensis]